MFFSLLMILLISLVLGGSLYFRFKYILIDEVNRDIVREAEESSAQIDNYLEQFVSPLIRLSQNNNITSMEWENQKKLISEQVYSQYLDVAVVDLDGIAHYTDDAILDLSDRTYIQKALIGNTAFSDVIISRKTNKPVIMVGVPIYQNHVIKGALIARLEVDFLSSSIHGYGDKGWAYVLSEDGAIISETGQEKSESSFNLFNLSKIDSKYKPFADFVKNRLNNNSGFGKYTNEKKAVLMGYSAISDSNWRVYVATYESNVLTSLPMLQRMMVLIVTALMLICVTIAWILVDHFTKPIVELDQLFSKGARGDLTIRFTPKTKDEIGRLGISFNRMMDKIKTLTQFDPLTGLLNAYVLEKDVDSIIHNEIITDFSLIMVSIDKFSMINDTYSYTTGDELLQQIAFRINTCCGDQHQIYRYKGDKFVLLCQNDLLIRNINQLSHKIFDELSESYQINGKIINISVSIGTFVWDDNSRTEDPLNAVTQAKNYAKYLGGNQVQIFDRRIYQNILVMKSIQADILEGINQEQFYLVYQPLFDLNNDNLAEVEALIRWNHPDKGILYPDQFIDLAETTGSIIKIDMWVMETACKQLKKWKDSGSSRVTVSVNLSSKTFETINFIPDLLELIQLYDIDPVLLQLEITERMLIRNVEESIKKLNHLRKMGIRVAIDDFGIGYSSLSYIVRLPIDSIKIDKSFVQNIGSSKEAEAIVSSIINLCKTLNLNVIAEGIENQNELDYLRLNQCDIGQGYYFSKPVSIYEIEKKFLGGHS